MEGANGIGIYDYERYYHSKMKKWGIKNVDELCPEDKKKFDDEVDNDWKKGGNKVKVNMPECRKGYSQKCKMLKVRQGQFGLCNKASWGEKFNCINIW